MADGRDRSSEDREAARVERERRRAAREGRGSAEREVDPEPVGETEPPAGQPDGGPRSAEPEAVGGPGQPESEKAELAQSESESGSEPESEPEPVSRINEGAATRQPEPAGISGRPIKSFPSPPDPDFYSDEQTDAEVASGTRRVSRLGATGARKPRPIKRRRRPVRRAARGGPVGRRTSWRGRIASLIALILAGALVWFLIELFQPFGTSPHGNVTVTIPPHASSKQIGKLLESDGVISSSFFFELRATLAGDRSSMRSGTYHLQQDMTYHSVLTRLTKVPKAAKTSRLTISEGHTRRYVSDLLRKQKIKGNYLAATRRSKLLDPHKYGAPRTVPSLEGFLFPDTFTLVDPVRVSALVDDQLKDFTRRFSAVNLNAARRMHLSAYDVLKVASLIEAEAASRRDRPLVASVIYNRLKDHMMLGLDSTTRYATGNATRPLTVSQLNSRSPYNTRNHLGLPPTPIDSPGLSSINAAAHPAKTRYLYFFAKPCTNQTVFATSYSQFLNLLQRDRRPHCGK